MSTETAETAVGGYDVDELAARIGLSRWDVQRAVAKQLLPAADVDGTRWSAALAATIAVGDELVDALDADCRWGALRCAERLAVRSGLPIGPDDIEDLAEQGLVAAVDTYKGHPLYRVGDLVALVGGPDLAVAVADHRAWMAGSLDAFDAARRLGWHTEDLASAAAAAGVRPGRQDRYAIADLDRLAADEQFMAGRLLGPNQAAEYLEIRRTDFDYVIAAGWLDAARFRKMPVGRSSMVTVPLYRAGDLDDVLHIPGVDWRRVREVAKGRTSRLREFVAKPPSRARIIHRLARDLGTRFRTDVYVWFNGHEWELDWTVDELGGPTAKQITAAIAEDPVTAQYRKDLQVGTERGGAIRWATAMLAAGAAVICDTETTDLFGAIVEIAVIDAATGRTLLDTLVNPGCPIEPGAQAIHGISDADVANAPTWDKVLPRLKRVTKGKQVLAYNADYDQGVVLRDTERAGRKAGHLADADRWACVMQARSDWAGSRRWLPLGGGHRAVGDCQAAREVLIDMSQTSQQRPARSRARC
ncbi:exonuclease domain-containing protein [Krasilnikovia sp. MM14-A1259]|uniref:3'-5' exonuclease n=1 Tax=Krasilnikovia sp. MM14-A1259 TaxID=3373539 RepID=UPI00382C1917